MDIRPGTLSEFTGQAQARKVIGILLADAKANGNPCPHVLLHGGAGLGKTTIANIVANEMGGKLVLTNGINLKTPKDVYSVLIALDPFDILFIDECHEIKTPESLLTALEDGRIEIPVTSGKVTMTFSYKLPLVTVIGATTDASALPAALRNRFTQINLVPYTDTEMTSIVKRSVLANGLSADDESVLQIVMRSRSTPRQANQYIQFIRAMAAGRKIDTLLVAEAFNVLEVDTLGLTELDRRYLRTIIEKYDGGAVGLETLAATLGEEPRALKNMLEPYLLSKFLIELTRAGRIALPKAYLHLGYTPKEEKLL